MSMHRPEIGEVVRRDPRYAPEAYYFLYEALEHTQRLLGRKPRPQAGEKVEASYHVTGQQLLEGVRDLALRQFGLMARTVFRMWGINTTDDVGEIVFNLVESGLMFTTAEDRRSDFHNVYDLDQALVQGYRIRLDDAE
jgi:uncharacterized repeat protein (TIGR04138 family)